MTNVPIPKRMRALERDKRGYPVPFIVLRDMNNKPHFAVNNATRQRRCAIEGRCAICGSKLGRLLWLVGGPLSAFHEHGSYLDSALHHECMTYALRVCPYLAAPVYSGRIDAGTIDPAALPATAVMIDYTMIPERPEVFVAVAARSLLFHKDSTGAYYLHPARPYVSIEVWRGGRKLDADEGTAAIMRACPWFDLNSFLEH